MVNHFLQAWVKVLCPAVASLRVRCGLAVHRIGMAVFRFVRFGRVSDRAGRASLVQNLRAVAKETPSFQVPFTGPINKNFNKTMNANGSRLWRVPILR